MPEATSELSVSHMNVINTTPSAMKPTEQQLARGLSLLGQSASGHGYVFRKLSLPGAQFTSVAFVSKLPHLEFLEMPCNQIMDASALGTLQFLFAADLSYNLLQAFDLVDPGPLNLKWLDLSRNQIPSVLSFGKHAYLRFLCLDRNLITNLDGLQGCRCLTHLSLANNGIQSLNGLEGLPLQFLDVRWNRIDNIAATQQLPELVELLLSHNALSGLLNLAPSCKHLRELAVDHNLLSSTADVQHLRQFRTLSDLKLTGNPLASTDQEYRLRLLYFLPWLSVLDGLTAGFDEKVAAVNRFNPPAFVVQAVGHARALEEEAALSIPLLSPDWGTISNAQLEEMFSKLEPPRAPLSSESTKTGTPPSDMATQPVEAQRDTMNPADLFVPPTVGEPSLFPVLSDPGVWQVRPYTLYYSERGLGNPPCPFRPWVIAGPPGVGKRTLVTALVQEYPQVFDVVVRHTTRKPMPWELPGIHYHFTSRDEMDTMVQARKMAFVVSRGGHSYGMAIESLARIRNEGKVPLIVVELEGALALYHAQMATKYLWLTVADATTLRERLEKWQRQSPQRNPSPALDRGENILRKAPLPRTASPPVLLGSACPLPPVVPMGGGGRRPASPREVEGDFSRKRTDGHGSNLPKGIRMNRERVWGEEDSDAPGLEGEDSHDRQDRRTWGASLPPKGYRSDSEEGRISSGRGGGLVQVEVQARLDYAQGRGSEFLERIVQELAINKDGGDHDDSSSAAGCPLAVTRIAKASPIPWAAMIVNDDMDEAYATFRKMVMHDFWAHYSGQVEQERSHAIGVTGLSI